MRVKIDTREKLHVITMDESFISANMTEKMDKVLIPLLEDNVKNVIINMKDTKKLDNAAAEHILAIQQKFYEHGASFVLYAVQPEIKLVFDHLELLELLNYTPTESEAMDIVHMEEIERELEDEL